MAIRITMINSAAFPDTAGDGLLMSQRRMYQRWCCWWFNDRLTHRLKLEPSRMLSGTVNLFTAECDSFYFTCWKKKKISSNKSWKSRGKESPLMKQSTFWGVWQEDRKAANDSDRKVTYNNCSANKLTDAEMECVMSQADISLTEIFRHCTLLF